MERKWEIRNYKNGDEKLIAELYRIVFGKKLSIDRWNWLYNRKGAYPKFIALAESNSGRIVGHYALMPVKVKCGKNTGMIGTLSLDTMVHPDYRKQGMFPILAKYIYDQASRNQVPFTYGFPNENSYKGFVKKLNWVSFHDRLPLIAKIINTKSVLSKVFQEGFAFDTIFRVSDSVLTLYYKIKKRILPNDYIVEKIDRFGIWADVLWEKVSKNFKVAVVRNADYLNWRYIDNPTESYHSFSVKKNNNIIAYFVVKIERRFELKIGYIVDILVSSKKQEVIIGIISHAVDILSNNHVDIVNTLIYNSHYLNAFKKNGFMIIPRKFYPQDIHLGVLCHMPKNEDVVNNENNWFLTWGDSDIV